MLELGRRLEDVEKIPCSLYSNLRAVLDAELAYRFGRITDFELYLIRARDIKPFIDAASLFDSTILTYERPIILLRAYDILLKDYVDIYYDKLKGIVTPLSISRIPLAKFRELRNSILGSIYEEVKSKERMNSRIIERIMLLIREIERRYEYL